MNFAENSLTRILFENALRFPDKIAYTVLDNEGAVLESITYRQLARRAANVSSALNAGKRRDEHILLCLETGIAFVVAFFGVLLAGATAVPIAPKLLLSGNAQFEQMTRLLGLASAIGDPRSIKRLRKLSAGLRCFDLDDLERAGLSGKEPTREPAEIAVVQFTSGSTSAPRGVMVSHANFISNAHLLTRTFDAGANDVALSWLPLFHDMGLMTGLIWPMVEGASSYLLRPGAFALRPSVWPEAISTYRATISSAPNFAFQICADRTSDEQLSLLDLSQWRIAICGAEPVKAGTLNAFLERFSSVGFRKTSLYPAYGLAEATLFVSGGPAGTQSAHLSASATLPWGEPVSCGRPGQGLTVAVVDPDTCVAVDDGVVGEIWISGPSVAKGYVGETESPSFKAKLSGQGPSLKDREFLRTGDAGALQDGQLTVTGRLKECLIVRGANIWPQDIEYASQAADPQLGSYPAFAFEIEGCGESEIILLQEAPALDQSECAGVLDKIRVAVAARCGVQLDRTVLIRRGQLPRTTSGKIRRAFARDSWLKGQIEALPWATGMAELQRDSC